MPTKSSVNKKKGQLEGALKKGDREAVVAILEEGEIDVNVQISTHQEHPLVLMVKKNNTAMVKLLLEYDVHQKAKNDAVSLALMTAKSVHDMNNMVKILLEHGAVINDVNIYIKFLLKNHSHQAMCSMLPPILCDTIMDAAARRTMLYILFYVSIMGDRVMKPCKEALYTFRGPQYEFVAYLLEKGLDPLCEVWPPMYHNRFMLLSFQKAKLTLPTICLLARTSTTMTLIDKLSNRIVELTCTMLYKTAGPESKEDQLHDHWPKIQALFCVFDMVLCSFGAQNANQLISNFNTAIALSATEGDLQQILPSPTDTINPKTLVQCCRHSIIKSVQSPNLLCAVEKIPNIPKNMKKLIVLENMAEVRYLEGVS